MDKATVIDTKIVKRLLNKPDRRSKQGLRDRAVLFLLSVGLRRGEVCNLNLEDFNPAGWMRVRTTKQGKPRRVKLTPEIVTAIETYRTSRQNWKKPSHDSDALLLTMGKFGPYPARRITPMVINCLVAKALREAGINGERITPHSFRHNCATTMLRQGRDLKTVQTVLGHRSIGTTSMYLHALDVDAAFEGLPWLRIGKRRKR